MNMHQTDELPARNGSGQTKTIDQNDDLMAWDRDTTVPRGMRVSRWSLSANKRVFDLTCVLLSLPFFIPVLLVTGLAVRLTSTGPVLFMQKRMGRNGRTFTIFKFRTLQHNLFPGRDSYQTFTPIGLFVRRWKLDELPQLWNVLRGDMSLVGPRPKLPHHVIGELPYRPGITCAATLAFAREEELLVFVPVQSLESYYRDIILPAKWFLDRRYMARATFRSDLELIFDSSLRRWDKSILERLIKRKQFEGLSAIEVLPEIKELSTTEGSSAIQWFSAGALAAAAVAVLTQVLRLIKFDRHYIFLLIALIVGIAQLVKATISTLINERAKRERELNALAEELNSRVIKYARG
jgi:lipopolysaccharide/colanic/teichoic acid biosynthesis glycosyltransferase